MQKRLLITLLLILVCSSCDQSPSSNENANTSARKEAPEQEKKEEKKRPNPQNLDEALANSLIELNPQFIALADGGAYAITGYGVWYLKEGQAIKVKEVPSKISKQSASSYIPLEKKLWVLWQNERHSHLLDLASSKNKIEELEERIIELEDKF